MAARAQRSAPTYFTLKSCSRSSSTIVSMGPVAVAEPPGGRAAVHQDVQPAELGRGLGHHASTCALLVTSAASGMMRRPVSVASSRAVASS